MAPPATAQAELCRLRHDIARIEGRFAEAERLTLEPVSASSATSPSGDEEELRLRRPAGRLALETAALDALLGGGLPLAALHEVRCSESRDSGAASGFVLALAARFAMTARRPSIVWVSEADARREAGCLYAPGLAALGLDPASVVEVAAHTQEEALWAFEAALSCSDLDVAICELRRASLDLSATRRCALRAREAGVTGFLLRLGSGAEPSAAEVRFRLSPAPAGVLGRFAAGIGRMAWHLILEKNRAGTTGALTLEWNAHERVFVEREGGISRAHPQPLSSTPFHRQAPAVRSERGVFRQADLRRAS